MNTNRNRYSSAPTYGMQRRTPSRKAAPTNVPPKQVPPPYPQQSNAYPQGNNMPPGMYPQSPAPQGYQPQPGQNPYANTQGGMYPPAGYNNAANGYYPGQAVPGQPQQPYNQYGYPTAAPVTPPQAAQQMPYPPQQAPYAAPAPTKPPKKASVNSSWMSALLLVLLPILFILTLFLSYPALKWVFIGLTVLSMAAMWLQRSFVSSARATLSLVYGALLVVCAVSLVTSSSPLNMNYTKNNDTVTTNAGANSASNNNNNNANIVDLNPNQVAAPTEAPTPPPEPLGQSAAELQLQNFMDYWVAWKPAEMTSFCAPSWSSSVEEPANALFYILQNRIPLSYEIEKISGTDADSSRTVSMTAEIDKRNSRDPVKYRFSVLMLKENSTWYVDPQSLSSNEPVSTATVTPDEVVPTPDASSSTTDANMILYYNKTGNGTYYHADGDCSEVGDKFKPMAEFYFKDLNNSTYKSLKRCTKCSAPIRE